MPIPGHEDRILYIDRFVTGLHTNRSALAAPFGNRFDAVIDGSNMELGDDLIWRRRAGHSKWSAAALAAGEIPRRFHTWRSFSGLEGIFVDVTTAVKLFNLSGAVTATITTTSGADTASFVSIGDTTYIANGSDRLKYVKNVGTSNWGIDAGTTAPTIAPVSGSLSPTVGFRYVYCYKNSTTLHISTASPASASTGPDTSKQFNLTGPRSTDPQVDKVEIYRTKDGGSIFFFLTEIANPASGDWTFGDNTADSALNTAKTAPVAHLNDRPPTGIKNICFHAGRVWGSAGNKVYYASGPDVLNGVPEEAWNPLNFFSFPGTVTHLLPFQFGLLVFTPGDIYLIRGVQAGGFYPQLWLGGVGVLAPTAVDLYGGTLYVYTTTRQLLAVDATISNPGFVIGKTVFPDFDPAKVHLAAHKQSDKDAALYVSNGSTKYLRYSFSLQSWSPPATIVGGCGAIKSIETAAGVHSLLVGRASAAGFILKRDLTVNTDDASTFAASLTFGSLMLAKPSALVDIDSVLIERSAAGTHPTVSFLPNEISGSFFELPNPVDEPPSLPASATVIAKRHYLKAVQTPVSSWMRHMQLKIDWQPEDAANELLSFAIYRSDVR